MARNVAADIPTSRAVLPEVAGNVPLTPVQRWFFERDLPQSQHFHQAVWLTVPSDLRTRLLARSLSVLQAHHDALRLRFKRGDGGWQQLSASSEVPVPVTTISLAALSHEEREAACARAASELQASLDLAQGPIYRVALFDFGPQRPGRLFWLIHHLAVDWVSWRVLLADLERAYQQVEVGTEIVLPPKTTSYKRWGEELERYARSPALKREVAIWCERSGERTRSLPADFSRSGNTMASARTVSAALDVADTEELLTTVPKIYRMRVVEVLLAALAVTYRDWTGDHRLLVDLEGHGREDLFEGVDLSRTVGCFTTLHPVLIDLRHASHTGEILKAAKEKLRAVPNRGIGYGVLRHLAAEDESVQRLHALQPAEVIFKYLGQLDPATSGPSLFALEQEPSGRLTAHGGQRSHVLEINSWVSESCLRMHWIYSENSHRQTTINGLANGFLSAIRLLLEHCRSPAAGGYTPSDFPEARLRQPDLDKLVLRLKGHDSA